MLRAKRLLVAALIATVLGLAPTRPAEASACFDQLLSDTAACLAERDKCIDESSFWTRTCNIGYLICETGAQLAYADCNLAAIGTVLAAIAR